MNIKYLATSFTEAETATLKRYIEEFGCELSLVYAIDASKVSGVDEPNRMIFVGGLYLCEEKSEPGEWYMGQQLNGGKYDFWGCYGDLDTALRGL